jgi:hypothetical protein
VVVRPPHVDHPVEPSFELDPHVRAVGGEIRGLAVGSDQHPVLLVAEPLGTEPHRPLGVVGQVALAQERNRLLDPALSVERRFLEPQVDADAHAAERGPDPCQDAADPLVAETR